MDEACSRQIARDHDADSNISSFCCQRKLMGRDGPIAEQAGRGERSPAPAPISRRRVLTVVGWGTAGGIVTGGIAAALIGRKTGEPDVWQLETVPTTALPQVESTLAPDQAARLMEGARRCREPLARVAIWHGPNAPGGTVSIISGTYHSPLFALATTPTLVALPFPAPYASGQGLLTVVGEANDFAISLKPLHMTNIKGTLPIRVWWTPVQGCP